MAMYFITTTWPPGDLQLICKGTHLLSGKHGRAIQTEKAVDPYQYSKQYGFTLQLAGNCVLQQAHEQILLVLYSKELDFVTYSIDMNLSKQAF